ncbi:hypothetical protein LTS07_005647 [Exophiala sideris]|nr:hypothetical protein LTS07_005647 [Exophiala sideris]KAK5031637.1 hypothetical protein LTR13_007626 [Exophiala sideris]KAK5180244.1 hypothetical protein LTR44_007369 [Eurotiomycetes sp. CCFEE 6388]
MSATAQSTHDQALEFQDNLNSSDIEPSTDDESGNPFAKRGANRIVMMFANVEENRVSSKKTYNQLQKNGVQVSSIGSQAVFHSWKNTYEAWISRQRKGSTGPPSIENIIRFLDGTLLVKGESMEAVWKRHRYTTVKISCPIQTVYWSDLFAENGRLLWAPTKVGASSRNAPARRHSDTQARPDSPIFEVTSATPRGRGTRQSGRETQSSVKHQTSTRSLPDSSGHVKSERKWRDPSVGTPYNKRNRTKAEFIELDDGDRGAFLPEADPNSEVAGPYLAKCTFLKDSAQLVGVPFEEDLWRDVLKAAEQEGLAGWEPKLNDILPD